ncbi:unnamed protein product [Callosobruchus maculatus]|uniref:HIG1 domain-containing protein n=1 Tax=Callosobruchus maculatus TaxID=64391 RepID=A0A653D910_CALMS|nr:unnamed protein product [Callosobruchus maculatus]
MGMEDNNMVQLTDEEIAKFDWLSLHNDMDRILPTETFSQKFVRKFKENPFVPIGCGATAAALCYGLWCFRTGQRKMSQYMMRTRIIAQGLTVFALVGGIAMGAKKAI